MLPPAPASPGSCSVSLPVEQRFSQRMLSLDYRRQNKPVSLCVKYDEVAPVRSFRVLLGVVVVFSLFPQFNFIPFPRCQKCFVVLCWISR